jgi:hypothetical protein
MKNKTCSGINKAKHIEGCGKETFKRTSGLCSACYYHFLTTDEIGKIIYHKSFLPKVSLKLKSFNQKQTREQKEKLKTLSDFQKDLQKEINTVVRLIDKDSQCISTLKPLNTKFDAGHMYSVGSNPAIRFHLDNIHAQSVYANQYLSGDQINYINGLSKVYGSEYKEYVLSLKGSLNDLKMNKDEIKEKIVIAKEIVKELKEENKTYSVAERLFLRAKYNQVLGIYNY